MNIAFFEIKDWEIEQLKYVFKEHNLYFFKEILSIDHLDKIKDCEILSVFIYSKITNNVIKKLPRLKYITTRSMGFDHIDLSVCKKSKIKVSNAPHYGDNSVAEHTLGLILSLSRNIHKAYLKTINQDYSIEGLKGTDLKGKTLGVIGVGRIGSHVIQMARGFEMNVIAADNFQDKKLAKKLKFQYVKLSELLEKSDIISIHVPYMKENHHLINAQSLSKVKKGAILINTARGAIVDTKAVIDALDKGILSGVGIDVIEGEELIKEENELLHDEKKLDVQKIRQILLDHKLLHDERVVFTPHIAFYTKEAVQRILDVTMQNIQSFIKKKPINMIN